MYYDLKKNNPIQKLGNDLNRHSKHTKRCSTSLVTETHSKTITRYDFTFTHLAECKSWTILGTGKAIEQRGPSGLLWELS